MRFRAALILAGALLAAAPLGAVNAPPLGTAADFAVLAAAGASNRGPSAIDGGLGLSPGTELSGFEYVVSGRVNVNDSIAQVAQSDADTAFNSLGVQPCQTDLTGEDLAGRTLRPGTYCSRGDLALSGTLTLDGVGSPDALFVFQIAGDLLAAPGARVTAANAAKPCNVFWKVDGEAELGAGSSFGGTLLALSSIRALSGASIEGRLFSRHGSVTLDSVKAGGCPAPLRDHALTPTGAMNGSGAIAQGNSKIHYVFNLPCTPAQAATNLEVSWEGNTFQLDELVTASCFDDPSIGRNPAAGGFDTHRGTGTGRLNGKPGFTARWTFTDSGDSGEPEYAEIQVLDFGVPRLSVTGAVEGGDHAARAQ